MPRSQVALKKALPEKSVHMLSVSSAPSCFLFFPGFSPSLLINCQISLCVKKEGEGRTHLSQVKSPGAAHPAATTLPAWTWAEQIPVLRQRVLVLSRHEAWATCLSASSSSEIFFRREKINRHLDFAIDTKQLWGFK